MVRWVVLMFVALQLIFGSAAKIQAQNPFLSNNGPERVEQKPLAQKTFLTKIALYQQKLKKKMTASIHEIETSGSIRPVIAVLMLAFLFGIVHAAGPGHGKAVAMSYILSRNPSFAGGLLFGILIAFSHGLSGVICVFGLHYVLKSSISGTLAGVSHVTQIVSFGLIALLGLFILIKNGYALISRLGSPPELSENGRNTSGKGLLPWAVTVGLVPCPGVVMVMLFCLSMNAAVLGVALAACISLGMAVTVSFFVILVVAGKAGIFNVIPTRRVETIEGVIGLASGAATATLGTIFLLAILR